MDARLQHFAHGYSHDLKVLRVKVAPPSARAVRLRDGIVRQRWAANTRPGTPRPGTLTGADVWVSSPWAGLLPGIQANPKVYQ
jgi:hypothetical protein